MKIAALPHSRFLGLEEAEPPALLRLTERAMALFPAAIDLHDGQEQLVTSFEFTWFLAA